MVVVTGVYSRRTAEFRDGPTDLAVTHEATTNAYNNTTQAHGGPDHDLSFVLLVSLWRIYIGQPAARSMLVNTHTGRTF